MSWPVRPVDPLTGHSDFALARYHPNGTLDTTFGVDGLVITNFGGGSAAFAVALQLDGKIVAAGPTSDPSIDFRAGNFALARYHPNGSLDTTFSGDGLVITDFGGDEQATAVAAASGRQNCRGRLVRNLLNNWFA